MFFLFNKGLVMEGIFRSKDLSKPLLMNKKRSLRMILDLRALMEVILEYAEKMALVGFLNPRAFFRPSFPLSKRGTRRALKYTSLQVGSS